jgi:hypothetical protein
LRSAQNAAAVFQNQFWRDFYRALSDGVSRTSLVKVSALALWLFLFFTSQARAAEPLNLVIALDLTKSVAVGLPGQRQEFNKNVEATGEILARVSADSHVTIIGITDQSFAEPLLLLDARIPPDPGYFGERLATARQALLRAWLTRTKALQPRFKHTDIVGALLLASQVFQAEPKGRRVMVIFSDMRENAGNLSLERINLESGHLSRDRYAQGRDIPDLHGVEVHVLGADNAGKPMSYWTALRDFWTAYFKRTGADLKSYSVLREPPDLGP